MQLDAEFPLQPVKAAIPRTIEFFVKPLLCVMMLACHLRFQILYRQNGRTSLLTLIYITITDIYLVIQAL